tara:strand:- start:33152 stop:33535 length:384 start_codon:yes stop_codon:yes gene_type:complete
MNLPKEIVLNILSFIDHNTVKKIDMPYSYYKEYLINRCKYSKLEKWFTGVYNNLYDKCFTCNKELDSNLYVTIICMNCEILLDEYCTYPSVCIDCTNYKKISRGKIFTAVCPGCDSSRMNIAITSFS